MHHYHAFGLNIATDLTIPEFLALKDSTPIDIIIQAGFAADLKPCEQQENYQRLVINIPSVVRILIETGTRITYEQSPTCDHDHLRLFLLGSAMGALLQQRGHIVLHGNAVSQDGINATIFVGHSGAGKSTLAAWHYQQKARVLADDVSAIFFDGSGTPYVIPSYPQIKLWQSSADLLNIPTEDLRKLRQGEAKFALPIIDRFHPTPLVVTRIVEINPKLSTNTTYHGLGKLTLLKTHSYRYPFLRRMQLTDTYHKSLLQLAKHISVSTTNRIAI